MVAAWRPPSPPKWATTIARMGRPGRTEIVADHVPIGSHRPHGRGSRPESSHGTQTKSEPDNPIYALLRRGAAARYPEGPSPSRASISRPARACRSPRATTRKPSNSTPRPSTASSAAISIRCPIRGGARIANAISCVGHEPAATGIFALASLSLETGLSGPTEKTMSKRDYFHPGPWAARHSRSRAVRGRHARRTARCPRGGRHRGRCRHLNLHRRGGGAPPPSAARPVPVSSRASASM